VSLKDSSGKTLLGIQLDPYATSFRLVRLHVLIEEGKTLDAATLMEAVKAGHCFIGFDFLGDPSGFVFKAENGKIQGDEISLTPDTRLRVRSPVPARIVIFKDGAVWVDEMTASKEIQVTERGVYRVEVYLFDNLPWIISNPVYVTTDNTDRSADIR
jgi:hypothetical protein